MIDPLSRLIAIEEIKQLKARYFRAADTKDAALLRDVYHDDVTVDFRGAGIDPISGKNCLPGATDEVQHGADHVVAVSMAAMAGFSSVHHGHVPEIVIQDADRATGIWPMMDILLFNGGTPVKRLHGYGRYHESYERVDGRWKIRSIRFERCLLDIID